VEDIVGLYLDPPDKALVLAVDEKSQIQALDRTQPGLPLKKGRAGTMTHDYNSTRRLIVTGGGFGLTYDARYATDTRSSGGRFSPINRHSNVAGASWGMCPSPSLSQHT
jgi:hypothetical protein